MPKSGQKTALERQQAMRMAKRAEGLRANLHRRKEQMRAKQNKGTGSNG